MIQELNLVEDFLSLINQAKDIAICLNSKPDDEDVVLFAGLGLGLQTENKPKVWLTGNFQTQLSYPHKQDIKLSGQGNRDLVINLPLQEDQVERVYTTIGQDKKMQVVIEPKNGQSAPGIESVSIGYQGLKVDMVVLINVAQLSDLGEVYDQNRLLFQEVPIVHFHNESVSGLGKLNFAYQKNQGIDFLVDFFIQTKLDINPKGADILLWGLRYLSANFRPPVPASKFKTAGWLIEHGAKDQPVTQISSQNWIKPAPHHPSAV